MSNFPDDDCATCGIDTVGVGHVKCGRCGVLFCIRCYPDHKSKCHEDEYTIHPSQIQRPRERR